MNIEDAIIEVDEEEFVESIFKSISDYYTQNNMEEVKNGLIVLSYLDKAKESNLNIMYLYDCITNTYSYNVSEEKLYFVEGKK